MRDPAGGPAHREEHERRRVRQPERSRDRRETEIEIRRFLEQVGRGRLHAANQRPLLLVSGVLRQLEERRRSRIASRVQWMAEPGYAFTQAKSIADDASRAIRGADLREQRHDSRAVAAMTAPLERRERS